MNWNLRQDRRDRGGPGRTQHERLGGLVHETTPGATDGPGKTTNRPPH